MQSWKFEWTKQISKIEQDSLVLFAAVANDRIVLRFDTFLWLETATLIKCKKLLKFKIVWNVNVIYKYNLIFICCGRHIIVLIRDPLGASKYVIIICVECERTYYIAIDRISYNLCIMLITRNYLQIIQN